MVVTAMYASVFIVLAIVPVSYQQMNFNPEFYQHDTHRIVRNPVLPTDYVLQATSNRSDGDSVRSCLKLCIKEVECEATVFDATGCHFFSTAFNTTSDVSGVADAVYTESVCAASYWDRPSYCERAPSIHSDCQEYHENGARISGVYTLALEGFDSFDAWCQFDENNGWTVIQRREDGSQDFYLNWADYKQGFGTLSGEHWLGNDNIHALTQTNQKLHIFMRKWNGEEAFSDYSTFIVNDESDKYRLTMSGYSGSGGDAMGESAGHSLSNQYFSTKDVDNDLSGGSCAQSYKGGWWYNNCHDSNLNGLYCSGSSGNSECAIWSDHSTPLHYILMAVSRD